MNWQKKFNLDNLKVGDKVIIRRGLNVFKQYDSVGINEKMVNYGGKTFTISKAYKERVVEKFYLKEDRGAWTWTKAMFSGRSIK